jgi:hypothetical protein
MVREQVEGPDREYWWFIYTFDDPVANEIVAHMQIQHSENAAEDILCEDGKRRNLWRVRDYGVAHSAHKGLTGEFGRRAQIFAREGLNGKVRLWDPGAFGSLAGRASRRRRDCRTRMRQPKKALAA